MQDAHYCHRYDDFYASVYRHGIPCWASGPDGLKEIIKHTIDHIVLANPSPKGLSLIEIGCGEGICAPAIAGLGIAYTGVDISPQAIAKAKQRAPGHSSSIRFGVADALHLESDLLHSRYDLVLDSACFHMFVLELDRRQYLANIAALMKTDAVLLMLGALCREDAYGGAINTMEEYQRIFQRDLNQPTPWDAWDGDRYVKLQLPSFPTRPKAKASYLREFADAGFTVINAHKHPVGNKFDFILKPKRGCRQPAGQANA